MVDLNDNDPDLWRKQRVEDEMAEEDEPTDDKELIAELRMHHQQSKVVTERCIECGDLWPCIRVQAADRLEVLSTPYFEVQR
jgi:hypothetical protein